MKIPYALRSANQDACLRRRAAHLIRSFFIVATVLAWPISYPAAQEPRSPVSLPENSAKAEQVIQNLPSENLATPVTANQPPVGSSSTGRAANEVVAAALISSVAIAPAGQRASVRVDGKGRLDAQAIRLQNPERLVLDFAGTRLALQERVIPSEAAPIRRVRLVQYRPDVARLVVDLTAAIPCEIAHDGSSLVINLGAPTMSSKPKGASATPIAPARTNPPAGSPSSAATPKLEAQKPLNAQGAVLPRPSTGPPSLPTMSSGKNETVATSAASAGAATASATANSQPAKRILSPFGEINAPGAPSARGNAPSVQGQNPAPSVPTPQPTTVPTKDLAKPPQPADAPVAPSAPSPQANQQQPAYAPENAPPAVPSPQIVPEDKQALSVALNLENVDLYQVIRIIGTELKINYMVDPAVKGSVTINTSGAISRADLFSVLESILQVNGAAIVKQDGYYRIVPAGDAKVQPVPLEFAKAAEAPPTAGETLVLEVFPMRYVSVGEMGKVLAPFISPAGQVIVNEKGNVLLVLETPPKLKQVADLLNIFDSSTFSRQRVRLFQVTSNSAKSMIKELQDVFSGYSFTGTSAIRFVPIESLNAILAISPDPEAFKEIEAWIHQLDQAPPQQSGEQNYVYPVQNAKASDLRDILVELYGGSIQKPQEKPGSPIPRDPMVSQAAVEEAEKAMNPQAPELVQGRIHIMSDVKNNALIIQASPHDYEIIKRTIAELDLLPRQVLIDAKIYSVDLTGNLSLGISYYLGQQSSLPGPTPLNTSGSFAAGQSPGSLVASTFAIISQTRALQMFLNATDQRSRVKMLSAPSILVTDNTSARIQVGASVPIPIGSALTPVQSSGTSIFAQTIQYQDTGVILTVTPHINASGVVSLVLTQEVSSAIPNTTSGIVAPVINKSSFQTSVVLADGEPLALGGIISTTSTVSTDRIPLLGQIPYVGALFGTTNRKTDRSEIVLILTPHVLQSLPQAAAQSQEFIDRMRETKKEIDKKN